MKKYILVAAITIMALNANAQKLEKPVIDKITGDTTFNVKEQVLANPFTLPGHWLAGNVSKAKNYTLLYLHLKDGMDIYYSVYEGDKAIIKFINGKMLEISAVADEHSSLIPYASPAVTQSFIAYDLADADVEALKNNKISVIRIMTSKGPFDYEIKDGKSEVIKKQLELIAKK